MRNTTGCEGKGGSMSDIVYSITLVFMGPRETIAVMTSLHRSEATAQARMGELVEYMIEKRIIKSTEDLLVMDCSEATIHI